MKRLAVLWALLALIAFGSSAAWARPSFKDMSKAQQLANKAAFLAKIGKHEDAVEKLREAVKLHPKISYRTSLARSLIELDEFLEADALLDELAAEKNKTWRGKAAQKKAVKLGKELKERIPTLSVALVKPKPSEAEVSVTLDGEPFDPSVGPVPVNPGDHEVTASAEGYEEQSYEVTVEEKQEETIEVKLKGLAPVAPVETEEEEDSGGMGYWPAIVAWSIGGAALVVGVAFGVVSMDQTSTLYEDYDCKNDKCPQEAEDDLNVAKMNGNISTAAFAVAGAGLVAGTILWLVADGDADPEDEAVEGEDGELGEEDEDAAVRVRLQPLIGPGYLGVHGTF